MSELSMGEEGLGLKPGLAELKLEPGIHRDGDVEPLVDTPHTAARKSDKIRQIVNEHTSAESQKTVESILDQVSLLSPLDKLLLYLKLPSGRLADADPLRQPLNPLGSRSEIQLTINWIRTHLEEDPQISLPKHEVYDEYIGYCTTNSVKPLSTADFGKVMKQVYPQVRPRRLGTRGNSRYCYAGLRKRLRLDSPITPDIGTEGKKTEACDSEEELNSAASFLIREWVEKLLGVKFDTLTDLACHLLEKMYVDNRSVAAFTLLSSGARLGSMGKVLGSPGGGEAKHRDTQLQLQRKLQERQDQERDDQGRLEQKRKSGELEAAGFPMVAPHGTGKRSKVGEDQYGAGESVGMDYDLAMENGQQQRYSVVVPNSQAGSDHYVVNGGGNLVQPEGFDTGPQDFTNYSGSDRAEVTSSPLSLIQPTGLGIHQPRQASISLDKLPRKKQALAEAAANLALQQQQGVLFDASQQLLLATNNHTSVIKAGEKPKNKYKEAAEVEGWGEGSGELVEVKGETMGWEGGLGYDEPADLTTLGRNAWDKPVVASGGNSSDAQEEELVRYFTEQPSDSKDIDNKDQKLSQLRQLLEKQLKSPTQNVCGGGGAFKRTSLQLPMKQEVATSGSNLEPVLTTSTALNLNTNLSSRRRVSFNPLIVSDPAAITATTAPPASSGTCPVPPSPGTRRRHFSFQPISPRQSLPQSPPASPFISPRSTPVHMLRSRHSSGSALPLHLLPGGGANGQQGRQQHPSGSGSDISRAATFGSASESSTPFISPQGTPIPFNRSRHNSAQGRLCRSRHSSGLPVYARYQQPAMPYSPMALNNLNNPFSPQPSTPAHQADEPTYQSSPQFVTPPEDPRSRHSSAGSEPGTAAPRSAPLSPFHSSTGNGAAPPGVALGRQRHQSAGGLPAATIHYRPQPWGQTNGDHSLSGDFVLNSEVRADDCQTLLSETGDRQFPYSQSQPATPLGDGANHYPSFASNHGGQGQHQSQHSSYNNTPVPQEFGPDFSGVESGELEMGSMEENKVENQPDNINNTNKRKDNDDLDLALDALRDCDTDFSKFVQEVGGTSGQ